MTNTATEGVKRVEQTLLLSEAVKETREREESL
jgi:hypothetical protein